MYKFILSSPVLSMRSPHVLHGKLVETGELTLESSVSSDFSTSSPVGGGEAVEVSTTSPVASG